MKHRNTACHRAMMQVLKSARMAAGISGREVSARLGRHYNYAHRAETGERQLTLCEFVEYVRVCDGDPRDALAAVLRLCKW